MPRVLALRAEAAIACADGADVELVQLRKQARLRRRDRDVGRAGAADRASEPARARAAAAERCSRRCSDGRGGRGTSRTTPIRCRPRSKGSSSASSARASRRGRCASSRAICTRRRAASRAAVGPSTSRSERARASSKRELEATLDARTRRRSTEAIERYLAFYAIWARELVAADRRGRAVLPAALRAGHDARACSRRPDRSRASRSRPRSLAAARGELDRGRCRPPARLPRRRRGTSRCRRSANGRACCAMRSRARAARCSRDRASSRS